MQRNYLNRGKIESNWSELLCSKNGASRTEPKTGILTILFNTNRSTMLTAPHRPALPLCILFTASIHPMAVIFSCTDRSSDPQLASADLPTMWFTNSNEMRSGMPSQIATGTYCYRPLRFELHCLLILRRLLGLRLCPTTNASGREWGGKDNNGTTVSLGQ